MNPPKTLWLVGALAASLTLGACGSSLNSDGDDETRATAEKAFVGSEACKTCHPAQYEDFVQSGHNFKLSKVENGQVPTFPFSSVIGALETITDDDGVTDNSLGTPASYADISYVIGGYYWKARWVDSDGYIVTGTEVQYNLETGGMVAYSDGTVDKPYNCGNCHVTGWRHQDDTLNPDRQGDLPGMEGTWVAEGIQCESCHGAGAAHVASQKASDIVRVAGARTTSELLGDDMAYTKAVACSECHTRDGEKDYPTYTSPFNQAFPATSVKEGGRILAKGGLAQHHEQYDEMLGIDPDSADPKPLGKHLQAGVTCETCHDPHKTIVYEDVTGEPALVRECEDCHGEGEAFEVAMPSDSEMAAFSCEDCHMPNGAKSAVAHDAVGTGPVTGDVASHIFKIDLGKTQQFTDDGTYMYPWLTKDFACLTCHNGVTTFDLSTVDLSRYEFHRDTVGFDDPTAFRDTFAGSAVCGSCHEDQYAAFVESGHNFKLNKVENDTVPVFPFTSIDGALERIADDDGETDNSLGTPASYADVSYVIGGYGWKARWMDLDGYIVTGSQAQYNLENDTMSGYSNGTVDKPYNCGNCHVTGWKHQDEDLNASRQGNLPGIDGTWFDEGVQCESCHGAGLRHVFTRSADDITKAAAGRATADFLADDMAYGDPVACGECHTRDGEKDYPTYVSAYEGVAGVSDFLGGRIDASGGLTRHHEQYDELLGIDPDAPAAGSTRSGTFRSAKLDCVGCHDPHASTKHDDLAAGRGVIAACTDCHGDVTFTVDEHADQSCEDCHMPRMVKSAINTSGAAGAIFGDIRSHIFTVDLTKDPDTEQFTDGGNGWTYPWITSKFACGYCHGDYEDHVVELNADHGGKVHN
ncbi:MAG: hypothetical protein Kow0092_26980 [Deferrisomatales bacterium]